MLEAVKVGRKRVYIEILCHYVVLACSLHLFLKPMEKLPVHGSYKCVQPIMSYCGLRLKT